jgi:small subunit ribosomal protein S13
MVDDKNFRHLVRIANTDLDGRKMIYMALQKIKGIGCMYANALCVAVGIEKSKTAGYLSDAEAAKLDEAIKSPTRFNIPSWMLNRRRDPETNVDMHVVTTDLDLMKDNDIKLMKKIHCYKGIRHSQGLPVRGQRTKSNFRKNKGKRGAPIGVIRKKVEQKSGGDKDKGKDKKDSKDKK